MAEPADVDPLSARRLPAAAGLRLAYLLIQGGSSVLLFALLGHAMPAAPFNQVAVAQGILVLCQAVGDFGLSQAATTALTARATTHPALRAPLTSAAAITFLLGGVLAAILTLASALLLSGGAATATAIMAPASAATVAVAGADAILRSRGDFARPLTLVSMSRLAAFSGVAVALTTDNTALVAVGISLGTVIGSLPAAAVLVRLAPGSEREHVTWFVRATLPLGLSQVLVVASARINTLILGGVSTVREAAAFEGAWRLYQLGQYGGGVIASSAAPFIAQAVAGEDARAARVFVLRTLALAAALGAVVGLALLLLRGPLAAAFYPAGSERLEDLLVPLAIVTPLGVLGQVAGITLSATAAGRRAIPWAFLAGAAANLVWIALGAADRGAGAGVEAAAAGVLLLNLILIIRVAVSSSAAGRGPAASSPGATGPASPAPPP